MFRASDYEHPTLHPTYINKPMPQLQLQSAICPLEPAPVSARDKCVATVFDPVMAPVPLAHDVAYDPTHSQADWSGLRSLRQNERKHTQTHRSQRVNLVADERGLIGDNYIHDDGASRTKDRSSITGMRKDIVPDSYKSSGPLIGGIDTPEHYKTCYQQLTSHDQTSRDQLVLQKRMMPKRQHASGAQVENAAPTNAGSTNPYGNIKGFYAQKPINSNRSLLSNMGASIAGSGIGGSGSNNGRNL